MTYNKILSYNAPRLRKICDLYKQIICICSVQEPG